MKRLVSLWIGLIIGMMVVALIAAPITAFAQDGHGEDTEQGEGESPSDTHGEDAELADDLAPLRGAAVYAEFCQACQKPLFAEYNGQFPAESDNSPDWLDQFRGSPDSNELRQVHDKPEGIESSLENGSERDEDIPDWLARIRERSREDRESVEILSQSSAELDSSGFPEDPSQSPMDETAPEQSFQMQSTQPEAGGLLSAEILSDEPSHLDHVSGESFPDENGSGFEDGFTDQEIQAVPSDLPEFLPATSAEMPSSGELLTEGQAEAIDHSETYLNPSAVQVPDFIDDSLLSIDSNAEPPIESDEGVVSRVYPFEEKHHQPSRKDQLPISETENTFSLDWLKNLEKTNQQYEAEPLAESEEASQPAKTAPTEEIIDWLADLDKLASPGSVETVSEPESASIISEAVDIPDFSEDNLPSWFNVESGVESNTEKESVFSEEDDNLETPEMPDWLQAMRPIEAVAPLRANQEIEQRIEKTGPLAGYQGVLPGDTIITRFTKPPVYSSQLNVTEKQQSYASMLEEMLQFPAEGTVIPGKVAKPSPIARIIVGVFLICGLLFLLISGTQVSPLPELFPIETVSFYHSVLDWMAVSEHPARFLVAIEYEPARAGELEAIAVGPLEDLHAAGATLMFVSTSPTGPVLAERLTQNIDQIVSGQFINLGYLPGGSTGLAALADHASTSLPTLFDNSPSSLTKWGITKISDFEGVLVITDSPEVARNWVEQTQSALSGQPLLIISSAQSAPIILPYYQSGQVAGVISGIQGGAAYEQLSGPSISSIHHYWDTYQIGLLLVIVAILTGAILVSFSNLIRENRSRRKH